jgi:signal transduction histidine kinase
MTRERLAFGIAGVLLAVAAADAARRAPGFALAGDSLGFVILGVAAGLTAVAAGLATAAAGARSCGRLLSLAGCAWLAAGLATPGARGAVTFTLGLAVYAAAPALMGHALLVGAGDGLRGRPDRLAVVTLYAALAGLAGLLPALLSDPAAAGCGDCPANLLRIADAPEVAADLTRWGIRIGLVAVALTAALALWRLAASSPAARRRAAFVVVPGCGFLALACGELAHSWQRGFLAADTVDQALWRAQAGTLLAIGAGVALVHALALRRRAALARTVVGLSDPRRPGGLRAALAEQLGDPELDILYASPEGSWLDVLGEERAPPPGSPATPLIRDGSPVALLCHRPGLLEDPRLAGEIEQTVRLGLEHERLQAQLRRELAHLRRSRADLVAASEAERRLLERDLHDGAQQRLVAFAFELGLARPHAAPESAAALERAQHEVQDALAALREVAHGLYPIALAEAGLAAAVESLGDRRAGLLARGVPDERFTPAVEEAAYVAIARVAEQCAPAPLEVAAARDGDRLVIDMRSPAAPTDVVDIEDRVGALGGSFALRVAAGVEAQVKVELPCA